MNQRVEVPFGRIGVITSDLNKQLTNGETINSEIVLLKFAEILINTENMPAFVDFISGLPSDELKIQELDKLKDDEAKALVIERLSSNELKIKELDKLNKNKEKLTNTDIISNEKIEQKVSENMKMTLRNYQIKHIMLTKNENERAELKEKYGISDTELKNAMTQEKNAFENDKQQFIEKVANYYDDYHRQLIMIVDIVNNPNPYGVKIDDVLAYQAEKGIGMEQESKGKRK